MTTTGYATPCRACGHPEEDHHGPDSMCRAVVGRLQCLCRRFRP